MNGPRSEQKGRSRSTARQQGEEAGGDHSGGSQSMTARGKPQAANDWVSGGYSCLPSCGFDMARALGREAGAKWGAASGHDGRVILLSCCQRRCPVSSFLPFSPIVLGCRPGDRVAASSKVQRASPSARVREPMGACISASRTRQVAGSIPVEPSQLPDYTHSKLGSCPTINNRTQVSTSSFLEKWSSTREQNIFAAWTRTTAWPWHATARQRRSK